jgi:peptidoglycan hydrolase CwlO-like protein
MQKWLTVPEACQALGMSERTLRRHLKDEKYQSKLEDGRRFVLIELPDIDVSDDTQKLLAEKDARISELQNEVEYLRQKLDETEQTRQRTDQIIQQMQQDAESDKQRSDTIILQLTRQFEEQKKLLEDMRHRSLWSRVKTVFGFAAS